jgi:hypothetical protein
MYLVLCLKDTRFCRVPLKCEISARSSLFSHSRALRGCRAEKGHDASKFVVPVVLPAALLGTCPAGPRFPPLECTFDDFSLFIHQDVVKKRRAHGKGAPGLGGNKASSFAAPLDERAGTGILAACIRCQSIGFACACGRSNNYENLQQA